MFLNLTKKYLQNFLKAGSLRRPCQGGLMSVFINDCRLLSALSSLSQFGRGRLSLVAISFYTLSLLFWAMSLVRIYPGRASLRNVLKNLDSLALFKKRF